MMKLKEAIYAQAIREEKLRVPYQHAPNIFHVHEAGYCALSIYLSKLNTPSEKEDNDGRVNMLLADGHMHQAQLTGYMHRAPNIHITNIEEDRALLIDGIAIIGHPDAILYDAKSKKRWVIEIKGLTRYNRLFLNTKNCPTVEDDDIEGLKEGYPNAIPQSRLLTRMFDTEGAIVLVKNKDTSELKEFHIERDTEAEDRIIKKFMKIAEWLKQGTLPACDFIKGDKRSNYCKYVSQCGTGK